MYMQLGVAGLRALENYRVEDHVSLKTRCMQQLMPSLTEGPRNGAKPIAGY